MNMDTVVLLKHDPNWVFLYEIEKQRLLDASIDLSLKIEHIGSTSIPNIFAKPVIDIIIGTKTSQDIDIVTDIITTTGYIKEGARQDHVWLCSPSPLNRKYIIHLTYSGSTEWQRRIAFRDHLLKHPNKAVEYEKLKKALSKIHCSNLNFYTSGKAEFVQSCIEAELKNLS
jgi:GrpB-like predicted nucleotidyltransferase (UPF0157 family)